MIPSYRKNNKPDRESELGYGTTLLGKCLTRPLLVIALGCLIAFTLLLEIRFVW